MALSPHDDRPVESWNDRTNRTQDLYKLTQRLKRTKSPLPNDPFVKVDKGIPNNTDHRPKSAQVLNVPIASSIIFGANPVHAGDTVTVTANKGLAGVTHIDVGGVNVPTYTVLSDTSLTFVVPATASTGVVNFKTHGVVVPSPVSLGILKSATAASIHFTPTTRSVGGTVSVAADKGLSLITVIKVNGVTVVTKTLDTDVHLTFVVPVGATTGTVAFTNADGTVTSVDILTVA